MSQNGAALVLAAPLLAFAQAVTPASETRVAAPRLEPGALPVLGADADTGVQLGVFGQMAYLDGATFPYAWRLRAQAALSVKDGPSGLEIPLHDHYVRLDLPELPDRASRLFFDVTYARVINRGYFGIGNASVADPPAAAVVEPGRRNRYIVDTPFVRVTWLRKIVPRLQVLGAAQVQSPTVRAYAGSELEDDARTGALRASALSDAVRGTATTGVVLDTRDHETVPTRGFFHDLTARVSVDADGHSSWGATVAARAYATVVPRLLTVAGRILGDVVGGDVLLPEMTAYGGFQPGLIGGTRGVRGVPAGRYHGRTKVLGNLELRSFWWAFDVLGQKMDLGSAIFADGGRVLSGTFERSPSLDGTGFGLRWGAGLGPRLRWGDSLLIRFDVAHSPDTSPGSFGTALYIDADVVM